MAIAKRLARWCHVATWVGVLALGAALALAFAWSGDSEVGGWLAFMVRTFSVHAAVAAVVLAAIAWGLRRWRLGFAALAVAGLGFGLGRDHWPLPAGDGPAFRVMSRNVLISNRRVDLVVGEILRADPDVVVFQEVNGWWDSQLYGALHGVYAHLVRIDRVGHWGQAVYSKRPILGVEHAALSAHDYYPSVRVRLEHDGREVEVWNTHLRSPGSPWNVARQREQSLQLIADLDRAIREGREVVVVGDFNSTPASERAYRMRGMGMVEANAGGGWGGTWPNITALRHLPGVRIDQAWATPGLTFAASEVVGEYSGSDHRAIVVDVVNRVGTRGSMH